jgi:hypothetical protein
VLQSSLEILAVHAVAPHDFEPFLKFPVKLTIPSDIVSEME